MSLKRAPAKSKIKWEYLLNPKVQSTIVFTKERDDAARAVAHSKTAVLNRRKMPCAKCGKLYRGYGGLARHMRACG